MSRRRPSCSSGTWGDEAEGDPLKRSSSQSCSMQRTVGSRMVPTLVAATCACTQMQGDHEGQHKDKVIDERNN